MAPCIGSALIIGAGEAGSSIVGKVLSWRPFVFTGLISYSLYLWHWPVIVSQQMGILFGISAIRSQRFASLLTARRFDMLVELLVSFLLAVLSWRFVERPFRSGKLRLSGRPLFALASSAIIVLLMLGSWTVFASGFEHRFPASAVRVASNGNGEDENKLMRTGTCFITSDYHFEQYNFNVCLSQEQGRNNFLLMGDSHSAMLWSALASALPDANVMQASTNGCEPLLHPTGSPDCRKMMDYIFHSYLPVHPVQGVFLVGRWLEKDLDELTTTIAWAKQHQVPVTVFGPMPEYDGPLPRLLAYSIAWDEPALPSRHRVTSTALLDEKMRRMANDIWRVPYVSLYQEICGPKACEEYADEANKIPLMSDDNHLNQPGATLVVRRLVGKGELP